LNKTLKKLLLILLCLPLVVCASFPINTFFEECDNIILKDGKEISAKVIEITPKLIKYKRCDNLDGPLISIYKNEVLMLKYSNGSVQNIDVPRKEVGWLAIGSIFSVINALLLTMLAPDFVLLFAILAILLGTGSFRKKLWWMGLIGIICGSIIFISFVISNVK
jgi:hypothetical protein